MPSRLPAVLQTTSTVTRWRERTTRLEPVAEIGPVAPRDRVVRAERRWPGSGATIEAESTNVAAFDPVRDVRARRGEEPAGEDRPDVQAMCSTVVRSEVACSRSSSETRFGIPAQTAGRKKPVAMPLTPASATIAAGSSTNGSASERSRPHEIGDDHQPPPREAVDERAERQPDDDDREEVRDQEGRQPATGVGPVEDVDGERERREVRPDRRAGRRPEEQGEPPIAAE